jgi:pimeloyl-ACP methyl ester carboxylesterase
MMSTERMLLSRGIDVRRFVGWGNAQQPFGKWGKKRRLWGKIASFARQSNAIFKKPMRLPPGYEPGIFHKDSLRLHYARWGSGPHLLIAFHGFGRTHTDFLRFTRPMLQVFTVVGVDIFFHGQSGIENRRADAEPLSTQEYQAFFEDLLRHLQAPEQVYLMGYSLGGRLALKTAELLPHRVGGLYLFAPDGLTRNRWYVLLSHYAPGRALFRMVIRHNFWLHALSRFFIATGIISKRTAEFSMEQMRTPEMQWQVYHSWCFLRKLEPDFSTFAERLAPNETHIDLFFGAYDKIIPRRNARRLERAYPYLRVKTLRAGHTLLTAAMGEWVWREGLMKLPKAPKP